MSDSQRQDLVRWALRECDAWKSDPGGASCCRRSVESCSVVALDWELVGSYYPSRISIHWPLEWNAVCLNQTSLELQPWHLLLASPFRVAKGPQPTCLCPIKPCGRASGDPEKPGSSADRAAQRLLCFGLPCLCAGPRASRHRAAFVMLGLLQWLCATSTGGLASVRLASAYFSIANFTRSVAKTHSQVRSA